MVPAHPQPTNRKTATQAGLAYVADAKRNSRGRSRTDHASPKGGRPQRDQFQMPRRPRNRRTSVSPCDGDACCQCEGGRGRLERTSGSSQKPASTAKPKRVNFAGIKPATPHAGERWIASRHAPYYGHSPASTPFRDNSRATRSRSSAETMSTDTFASPLFASSILSS